MSKITTQVGGWTDECVLENNLVENAAKYPHYDDVLEYTGKRSTVAMIASGVMTDYQSELFSEKDGGVRTKFRQIPRDKKIGDSGYRYAVMGDLQKAMVINSQVGASTSDGKFTLSMKDKLFPNEVVRLHNERYAHVQSVTGSSGNYITELQMVEASTTFDWTTMVATQTGEKTLWCGHTGHGEKSTDGYGRTKFADVQVNFVTTQRKGFEISGDALNDVLWAYYGNQKIGWMWHQQQQMQTICRMEDEDQKLHGVTNMKNSDGSLKNESTLTDQQAGQLVTMGDGIYEQIRGVNDIYGSSSTGQVTLSDLEDWMQLMASKSNTVDGQMWYGLTGIQGIQRINSILKTETAAQIQYTVPATGNSGVGGLNIPVGFTFRTYNCNGKQFTAVEHPMFSNIKAFPRINGSGKYYKSNQIWAIQGGVTAEGPNIEIITKGDRREVSEYFQGLTGFKAFGRAVHSGDYIKWSYLKQDMAVVRGTQASGVAYLSA